MSKPFIAALGTLWLLAASAPATLAAGTPAQQCVGAKLRAAGKTLAAKTSCHARAKRAGSPVDAGCLARAEAKFTAAVTRAGAACEGTPATLESSVDDCVTSLLQSVPGNGKCPADSAKAAGKAGGGLLVCRGKDVTRPGTFAACDARVDGKLGSALAKAGACASTANVHATLHDCLAAIDTVVEPPPPTTITTSTTSSTTLPTCCELGPPGCTSNRDASTCSAADGVSGPPGSVCNGGTGACVNVSPSAGNCCTVLSQCIGGPNVSAANCGLSGGTFVVNALCLPTGGCAVPCQAVVGSFCWYLGADGTDCDTTCAAAGKAYDPATETYAGSLGSDFGCNDVAMALGMQTFVGATGTSYGCSELGAAHTVRGLMPSASNAGLGGVRRACACQ